MTFSTRSFILLKNITNTLYFKCWNTENVCEVFRRNEHDYKDFEHSEEIRKQC